MANLIPSPCWFGGAFPSAQLTCKMASFGLPESGSRRMRIKARPPAGIGPASIPNPKEKNRDAFNFWVFSIRAPGASPYDWKLSSSVTAQTPLATTCPVGSYE